MASLAPDFPESTFATVRVARALLVATTVFLAFGLFAYLSIELTRNTGRIASVWIPNALAVAYLLRTRAGLDKVVLAGCFLGNLAANLAVGDAASVAATLAIANTVEIILAVYLTRHWCGVRPDMADIAGLTRFMLAACLIAPIASSCIASLVLFEGARGWIEGAIRWAMSDALSMLVIAPSTLVFWDAIANRRKPTRSEAIDWILLTTFGTALTFLIFNQSSYPLLFLIPPIVVAHAFRLGSLGTAFSVLKVATIALFFTGLGRGPISTLALEADMKMLLLEAFLASATIVGMPVAAVLSTRERLAREVALSRQQLALLADNITDAILRYDLEGRCTYASPSVSRVLGARPSVFVGTTTAERSHPESRDAIAGVLHRLSSGKSETERFTYRRLIDDEDGNPVYLEADCAVARNGESGLREGIIVSARDVTVRVKLERQLKRATRHAENAARAKAQFLANMSHEIRTPMNGVLGFADLLRQMDLDEKATRYAEMIVRSARSMMMLLNDILDISKIESGQLVISLEEFELQQMAEDCISLHMATAESKGVRLTLNCDPALPRRALSDPLRLRQIMLNLIANGVKFTERGEVEVSMRSDGDWLSISVEDNGIGIARNRLEKIFDPFIQEEATTTRRFGGTGLGLSISRQLADLLGGSLVVDSMPGVGSRFTLRVPLEEAEARPDREERGRTTHLSPSPSRMAHVLLAEDHDVNRMLVVAMLEQLGQRVTVAKDGLEAVTAVLEANSSKDAFDLVLMDVQMPGCDGYSASRMIRNAGVTGNELPIVALTANAYPEDIIAAMDAGMQAHLAKPLVFEELSETLARWLPVKIVEEPIDAADAAGFSSRNPSPEMRERWNMRRSEAIEAVSEAVRNDAFEGVRIEELARTVHKLAGTAGMFGEAELGRKAAALERALRAGVEGAVRRKLAEELLAAA